MITKYMFVCLDAVQGKNGSVGNDVGISPTVHVYGNIEMQKP